MSWTRRELKDYAKDFLRKHYWKAFVVCLIFTLLSNSNSSSDSTSDYDYNYNQPSVFDNRYEFEDFSEITSRTSGVNRLASSFFSFPIWLIGTSTVAFLAILMLIISIFIGPLITVGKNRFFLQGFKGDVKIGYVFSTFNRDEFWGIFKCMFITNIKNFLWTLLLIIPGIIKAYEYSMVPYLLSKEPDLTSAEAIQISRGLTDGHKLDMFILDFSFLGWYFLGALLFGIGTFFVVPYEEASKARLFNVLSGNDGIDDNSSYDIVYE